jgi:hypothetical protein
MAKPDTSAGTIENVRVAVATRGHGDVGDIRPRFLLRQCERGDGLAGSRAFEQAALLRAPEQADRAGAEPLHGEGKIGEAVVPCQRFANEAERAHVKRRGRIGIRCGMLEPAVAAEAGDQIAAGRIDVAMIDRQIGRTPVIDRRRKRAMAVGKERPAEKSLVRH